MEHEFETPPASPVIKVAAGIVVALVIGVLSQMAGFVDLGFGSSESGVEVSEDGTDQPGTTDVPETLAYNDGGSESTGTTETETSPDGSSTNEAKGGSEESTTQPTVVESIELNPELENPASSTTSTTTTSTSTTEVPESSSTTDPDQTTSTTEPPELDENGDPIEDDPVSDYQPVIRNYGNSPEESS